MEIDHIFIFTNDGGKIADKLSEFGFTEGSNRIHRGQGTQNRKFYFKNFFLEILWVHNEAEISSAPVKETGLWERANHQITHFSPYGLCFVNTPETDSLFGAALKHQPAYFPEGLSIEILSNNSDPDLPWTFRLPFKEKTAQANEPTVHHNNIGRLTQAVFSYKNASKAFFTHFMNEKNIGFRKSDRTWLDLTFDNGEQGKLADFAPLKLTIHY